MSHSSTTGTKSKNGSRTDSWSARQADVLPKVWQMIQDFKWLDWLHSTEFSLPCRQCCLLTLQLKSTNELEVFCLFTGDCLPQVRCSEVGCLNMLVCNFFLIRCRIMVSATLFGCYQVALFQFLTNSSSIASNYVTSASACFSVKCHWYVKMKLHHFTALRPSIYPFNICHFGLIGSICYVIVYKLCTYAVFISWQTLAVW